MAVVFLHMNCSQAEVFMHKCPLLGIAPVLPPEAQADTEAVRSSAV